MMRLLTHRNSIKRIYLDDAIYFVTFKTYERYPYFQEPIFCDIFMENLKLCKKIKQFELYAFNLLYEHVHLLLKPDKKYNISKIIKSLKENTSRDCNRIISNQRPVSDTSTCRLLLRSKIRQYQKQFMEKYGKKQSIIPVFRWHKSFHDHVNRNEQDFRNHYEYTVYNHQKHGLSNNWKYTSLNFAEIIN